MAGRIHQLNGMRALAIGLVLVTHFWMYPEGQTILNRLAAAGWLGVQLSFVLSGFLITKILWRAREEPRYYLNFYARRSLRIFPLYYLLLATVFFALPFFVAIPQKLDDTSWMYWSYLSNFAIASDGWKLFLTDVTWSLAVEEQFYLVWPLLVRYFTRSGMVRFCVAVILLAPVARTIFWSPDHWMWIHMMMPLRADAFAVGALIALLPSEPLRVHARPILCLFGGTALILILSGNFSRASMFASTLGYSLVAIAAGAGLLLGMQSRIFAWKPLVGMGTVSYGIYLLHPLCLMVTSSLLAMAGFGARGLLESFLQVAVTAAAAIAAGTASYYLFESRVMKLRKYFDGRRPERRDDDQEALASSRS
jgi:peptidoglycan/LPS O-acetylase OafA/YrhL